MSTQGEIQRLEAEILAIESTLRESSRSAKRAAVVSAATATALLALVVSFVIVNYARVSAEMSTEKLSKSFTKELGEVTPLALTELNRLGQDVLPVYAREFQQQLEARWPDVASRVQHELDELASLVLSDANAALKASEERIEQSLRVAIFECYPEVQSAEQREEIERHLKVSCEQALNLTLDSFDRTFAKDVQRLQDTVLGFDVSDGDKDPAELQKQFIRLWLQLLDQEVLEI